MDGTSQAVTLAEVARAAGVSASTASRVLGDSGHLVRRDLRERVMDAARRLRYVPNAHAQALAGGLTSTVGLIVHDVSDPYFAAIARGAIEVADAHRAVVMLGSTFRSSQRELDYVTAFRSQRVKSILFAASGFADSDYQSAVQDQLARHCAGGGRYAFVSEHHMRGDVVVPDNAGGAAALARALVALGHRRFALAGGPSDLITIQDRTAGFVGALDPMRPTRATVRIIDQVFSEEGGRSAVTELLADRGDATALVCLSDAMAVGALAELRARGLEVPGDISVIGFGGTAIARALGLSTVAFDLEALGRRAMEFMFDDAGAATDRRVVFPADVLLRNTTGPPPSETASTPRERA